MSQPSILVLSILPENRERLCQWLAPLCHEQGRECIPLADADALWSLLWQDRLDPPGLLVYDGHPAEDSYPLINRLQGDQGGLQLPVLLLTDNLGDSSQRFYTELLFGVERLAKPVSAEALCDTAAACLALDDARRRIEAELAGADWKQTLREGLMAVDADGHIRYVNRQAARWLKLSPLALCRLNLQALLEAPVTGLAPGWADLPLAQAARQQAVEVQRLSFWRGDGGAQLVQAALVPFQAFPCLIAFRPVESDDSSRQSLSELARVDLLTGLPTRPHLEDAMAPLLREGQRPALMLLDIDHLRHVNETLGYDFGDQLLRAAAVRLRGSREAGLLASMGGGRFAFLVEEATDFRVAGRMAQRLQAQFRLPFLLAGHEVFCSVSIGIALYPASGDEPGQLLKGAERALERAKLVGRNVIQFDSAELNRFSIERLEREASFHQALNEGELSVGWKLWREASGHVVAVQPRAIWPGAPAGSPDLGVLAEECGLSRELYDWLFRQAVASAELPSPLPPGISLAFEVSNPQLLDAFVVQRLRAWINRHDVNPGQVHLFLPWRRDEAGLLARRVPELAAVGVHLSLYLDGHGGSVLDAFTTGPWQGMVLGRDYVQRLPPERAPDILGGMADFGRRMGWQLLSDGTPAGMDEASLFATGVIACSAEIEQLPSDFD
ncbi:MAG: diguanylate cyclase [Pedobacter sp.]|nr:diguanylate cyclase [Pedobacter sp.]